MEDFSVREVQAPPALLPGRLPLAAGGAESWGQRALRLPQLGSCCPPRARVVRDCRPAGMQRRNPSRTRAQEGITPVIITDLLKLLLEAVVGA